MKRIKWNKEHAESRYRIRIMSCIIAVELFMLALVLFWPKTRNEIIYQNYFTPEGTAIIEAPVITRQAGNPPPPPSPRTPVEVPDEVVVEDQQIEFLEFNDVGEADSASLITGNNGEQTGKIYSNPELAPSILYIVEPTVENRTENKALIYVSFLVSKEGNVEEATIDRILLFDDEGNPTKRVQQIDQRVLSATLEAALDWKFRPAKVNGKPVRAYTLQTFTIDY